MQDGVISQAKELGLDLVAFLEQEMGVKAAKTSRGFRFSSCPCCGEGPKGSLRLSVRDNQWHCFRGNQTGSIVDAAALLWGCSVIDAAIRMVKEDGTSQARPRYVPEPKQIVSDAAVSEATLKIHAALRGRSNDQAMQYLTKVRRISPAVVKECMERGMLGFMPGHPQHAKAMLEKYVGRDLLQEAGIWKAGSKAPAIAFRPICTFFPRNTRAEFRLIRDSKEGEPKGLKYGSMTYPWYFEQDSSTTAVVEGFIDLMSLLTLGWKGSIIGLPSANAWKAEWFKNNAQSRKVSTFVSMLDNDADQDDNPGKFWTDQLHKTMIGAGLNHLPRQPQSGDVNDLLKNGGSLNDLLRAA